MNLHVKYLAVIATLVVIMFIMKGCDNSKLERVEDEKALLLLDKQTIEKEINKKGDEIAIQKAIIVNNEKTLNKYTDSIFQLKEKVKKTLAYTRDITRTSIVNVDVPYTDSVPYPEYITDTFARAHMIIVPRTFEKDSSLFNIKGIVKKELVEISSIEIIDTTYGRFIEPKKKWFKRQPIEYQSFHSNPLVKSVNISSALYYPKKTPLIKKIAEIGILVGIGTLIGVSIK